MESFEEVYIAYADILGYENVRDRLKRLSKDSSLAILSSRINSLDRMKDWSDKHDKISWYKYGDAYLIHSHKKDETLLKEIIKTCCDLIGLTLQSHSIPLRIGITQDDLLVDKRNGLSISGDGWNNVRKIESSVNWMGGFLSLPRIYNNKQNEVLMELVQKRYLIKQQDRPSNIPRFTPHFHDKFKPTHREKNSWFLNWNRTLRLDESKTNSQIRNWWSGIPKVDVEIISDAKTKIKIREIEKKVEEKQNNTIEFVNYCRVLYQAANLVLWSEIYKNINIY